MENLVLNKIFKVEKVEGSTKKEQERSRVAQEMMA